MDNIELIIILLSAMVILAVATRRFIVPYPVVFVLGGILLSFYPQLAHINLEPHLAFVLFMPPVLFSAAYFTCWRDFRANLQSISLLAIALVILTTFIIALVIKWLLPQLPWAVACVLGAIISPPDAVAATAITQRLKIPKRIITILEGESLVNDASGLILYKFAVAAVVTGQFSLAHASIQFIFAGCGGVALGLMIGWLLVKLRQRLDDVTLSVTTSLLVPFITFIIAEKLALSGVLAVVAAGLLMGWYAPKSLSPHVRVRGAAVWETMIFVINGFVFMIIGLHLPIILQGLGDWSATKLILLAVTIVSVAILVRFLLVFFVVYVLRIIVVDKSCLHNSSARWRNSFIIAWTGMRGIVSLGAALALPYLQQNGIAFPARDLILFLTFACIIGTLVFQGLTLPFLIHWLGLKDDGLATHEERLARNHISQAMEEELKRLEAHGNISKHALKAAKRESLLYALTRLNDSINDLEIKDTAKELCEVRQRMIIIGRKVLIDLRHKGEISDEVLHTIQTELDLDEMRLKRC